MSRRMILVILGMASALIVSLLAFYWATFGFSRSTDQAVWGAFGDYFAGILNPIFALFAFVAVLWSLHLQIKQLGQITIDKQGEEILQVIKDIDSRITDLIADKPGGFNMPQMVSEAERNLKKTERSEEFSKFLRHAREAGGEVEAVIRNLEGLVISMYNFLERHPRGQNGALAPVIEYYIVKTSRLIPMLEVTASMPTKMITYFKAQQA